MKEKELQLLVCVCVCVSTLSAGLQGSRRHTGAFACFVNRSPLLSASLHVFLSASALCACVEHLNLSLNEVNRTGGEVFVGFYGMKNLISGY